MGGDGGGGGKSSTSMHFKPAKRSKEGEALLYSLMGLMGFPGYQMPSSWMASPAVAQYYNMIGNGYLQNLWGREHLGDAMYEGNRNAPNPSGSIVPTAPTEPTPPPATATTTKSMGTPQTWQDWWDSYQQWLNAGLGDFGVPAPPPPAAVGGSDIYQTTAGVGVPGYEGVQAAEDAAAAAGGTGTGGGGTWDTTGMGEGMPPLYNPADALAQYLLSTMKTSRDYQREQEFLHDLAAGGLIPYNYARGNLVAALKAPPVDVNFAGATIPIAPVRTRQSALQAYTGTVNPLLTEANMWQGAVGAQHNLYQDMMNRIFSPYMDLTQSLEAARYGQPGSRTSTTTTSSPGFLSNLLGTAGTLGTIWGLSRMGGPIGGGIGGLFGGGGGLF